MDHDDIDAKHWRCSACSTDHRADDLSDAQRRRCPACQARSGPLFGCGKCGTWTDDDASAVCASCFEATIDNPHT